MTRDDKFKAAAGELGYSFEGEIKIGGNYTPVMRTGNTLYVSGQVPRVGDTVVVTGRAGAETSLEEARKAARVCAMRALALLQKSLGSLEEIESIPRVAVFVQSAEHFTQLSEVADAASDLLQAVLGAAGVHARTSVGVFQLPKNATVELELMAVARST